MITRRKYSTAVFSLAAMAAGCSVAPVPQEPSSATASSSPSGSPAPEALTKPWQRALSKTPTANDGCFQATFPGTARQEVSCAKSPSVLHPVPEGPRSRPRAVMAPPSNASRPGLAPEIVGNTSGDGAPVVSGLHWAEGSFPREVGGTNETDNGSGVTNSGANSYSLQMNTNLFQTAMCNTASCRGWEQFVYDSRQGAAFIEFTLIGYSGSCPSGFTAYPDGRPNCYQNSSGVSVPAEAASNLQNVSMTAWTYQAPNTPYGSGNAYDYLTMTVSGQAYTLSQPSALGLASGGWTEAEFNVFGEDNGTQATFGGPASLEVQVLTESSATSRAAPTCISGSTTGETNTMSLVGACCPFGGDHPGIQFFESNVAGAAAPACPTITLFSNNATFLNNQINAAAGSTVTGTVTVAGGLVDSSLNAGLAPNTCTVTGDATVVNHPGAPVVTFDIAPFSAGESWAQTIQCDTSASVTETMNATSDVFLASPASISLIPGGASTTVQWGYSQPMAQFCAVPTYALVSGTVPSGLSASLDIDGLLTLSAASTLPDATYTLQVTSNCTNTDGPYVGDLTVNVVSCIPKTCNASSCQGTISNGCGGTLFCASSCASPDTCVAGTCTAPPPPPPPPPVATCNGVKRPVSACAAPNAWKCCSSWVCAKLCSIPKVGLASFADDDADASSHEDE